MKNKKGFTLIELLAIIIILAIIALISTPIVLNVIENARMRAAELSVTSYVKAIEGEVLYSSLEDKTYEDKDNYKYDEINVDVNGTIPSDGNYSLKEGIVNNGTFCIDDYVVEYKNSVSKVINKGCHNITTKLDGKVKLSSTSGSYVYPNSGSFEVIENISGGTLTCTSDNTNVATCSINGTVVTVTPGTEKGVATIIVKSEGTNNYKEAQAAYVVTTIPGLLSVTATGYTGEYDSELHGITVTSSGATIKYGTVEGIYDLTSSPTYKDVGTYTVYYEVTKTGYTTVTGSKNIVITKAAGSLIVPTAKVLTYIGSTQELINAGSSDTGTIQYKLEGEIYSTSIPTAINVGTYKVYYKVVGDSNHNDVEEASISVTIGKASNTLTLSASSGTYTYPTSGTFTVTENVSGGTLTCTSSNTNVATCSISGTTVTVTPGTTKGNATLTIKSAATTNYKEGQVTYVVTTKEGVLSATATGYSGVYDGNAHGITVTSSGATIKYGTTSGSYTLTSSPTYQDAGIYTIYYEVTKQGYTTITGSKQVIISKASGSVVAPTARTLTYTGSAQSLINAGSSSTGTIQYKLEGGSYSTSIPTATNAGTYKVYYKVVGDSNHNDVEEASIISYINAEKSGKAVYFNPDKNSKCTEAEEILNINSDGTKTGIKSGCMKWYIYNDDFSSTTVNMILDHNTTAYVVYNSTGDASTQKEVATQLLNDTATWNTNLKSRLITIEELAQITGYDSLDTTTTGGWFFETNSSKQPNTYTKKYAWLYDYTNCSKSQCNISESGVTGYWISTPAGNQLNSAFSVFTNGQITWTSSTYRDGIRPVITVSRNIIS